MIRSTDIQRGLSIYDYANTLLGGFDNIVLGVLKENPSFESMDVDLNDFVTQEINYDDSYYKDKAVQIQLSLPAPATPIKQIRSYRGQNIYDLNLMSYSGFNNVIRFLQDNGINSINDPDLPGKVFNFDTTFNNDLSLNSVIEKKQYIFTSASETNYRITTLGELRITTDGDFRIANG